MTAKNDVLNEETKATGLPPQEQILMNEQELIAGLLAASNYTEDEDSQKLVQVKRNKKIFFEFMIRPLGEKELMKIRKSSVDKYKNPHGKHLPQIEGDVRLYEFRSKKIYAATTDEYKAKLWDNPQVKASLVAQGKDIIESWEIIDAVLMAGEKDQISDLIDEISGYNNDENVTLEEYAKN